MILIHSDAAAEVIITELNQDAQIRAPLSQWLISEIVEGRTESEACRKMNSWPVNDNDSIQVCVYILWLETSEIGTYLDWPSIVSSCQEVSRQ